MQMNNIGLGIKDERTGDIFGGITGSFIVKKPRYHKMSFVTGSQKHPDSIPGPNYTEVEVISITDFKKFILPKLDGYVKQKSKELKRELEKITKFRNKDLILGEIKERYLNWYNTDLTEQREAATTLYAIGELLKKNKVI